jgi:hypothetical protein
MLYTEIDGNTWKDKTLLLKMNQTEEEREKIFRFIGGISQISLVICFLLGRLDISGLDFLEGMLLGFSIVGNLAYLYYKKCCAV